MGMFSKFDRQHAEKQLDAAGIEITSDRLLAVMLVLFLSGRIADLESSIRGIGQNR